MFRRELPEVPLKMDGVLDFGFGACFYRRNWYRNWRSKQLDRKHLLTVTEIPIALKDTSKKSKTHPADFKTEAVKNSVEYLMEREMLTALMLGDNVTWNNMRSLITSFGNFRKGLFLIFPLFLSFPYWFLNQRLLRLF